MKKIALILSILFILSACASTTYTPYNTKKANFLPTTDTDCRYDKTVSYDWFNGPGWICPNDNGILFIKYKAQEFKMSKNDRTKRAENYCKLYDKTAKFKGKANISMSSIAAFDGEEYFCLNE